MILKPKIACVIPARLNSTRLPGKMLLSLLNKPILQWVWESATKIHCFDHVTFAIDSPQIADLIDTFGGKYIMTSPDCKSGSDRLIEIMQSEKIIADIWVNWQGDEPFITPSMIKCLLQTVTTDTYVDMWTLKKRITSEEEVLSPKFAKVVCNTAGNAMYFSRNPIPHYRDNNNDPLDKRIYYKHVGIYAFATEALKKISQISTISNLEDAEKLEQLRFLQNNISIKVHETTEEVIGIDTAQDLIRAEQYAQKITI